MSIRLRHSFQVFPGFRINLSGSGLSATVGIPGANLNLSHLGMRATIGIPGSGISYVHHIGYPVPENDGRTPVERSKNPSYRSARPEVQKEFREIKSNSVASLTSDSMLHFKSSLKQLAMQRATIESEIDLLKSKIQNRSKILRKRKRSLFRYFYRKSVNILNTEIYWLTADLVAERKSLVSSFIPVTFELGQKALNAYGKLVGAFAELARCSAIWDLTADREIDKRLERSRASSAVVRKLVQLKFEKLNMLYCENESLKFQNANGEDLNFLPAFLIMLRSDKEFALVDFREIKIDITMTSFREHENIPQDAFVTGQAWSKENRDGSRDQRFKGNQQIPICKYAEIRFTSPEGLNEIYLFSNFESARNFYVSFVEYQSTLPTLTPAS